MNYPIVVTAGGTIVSGENGYLTTSRTAETVVTFDIGFPSLPSYTGGSIRQGDEVGFWSAPSNDTSEYLSVDPFSGTPSVISAPNGTLWKYFGLYWGSIDDYNSIEFWKDNTRIAYYSGSDIATLLNLRGGYINFDVNNNDGYFNKIILTSTQQAFESDNHAFISEFPGITLTVAPTSVTEDGTTNLVYTFTRTGSTTSALTANYTVGGTATNGTDYTSIPTSVTFAAGSSTATVTVDPTADTTVESDETVALTLASGTGYTVGTTTAVTGTITNDDFPSITLAVSPSSVNEDGTTNLVYTFTRSGVTTNPLTVNYTIGGTATLNTDYTRTGTTNTVTFAANSATATVTVDPTADTTIEPNETVILTLAAGTGYTIGTPNAVTGTITNDDNPGSIQGLKWNDINGNGVREDLIQGNPPDIVFVIDVSGSTSSPFQGLAVGDVNNDGTANTRLDAEIAGFIALNNRLVSQGLGSARISIVSFESSANQRDMNPTISGIQLTTNPATDSNNNGIKDVEEILRSLVASGGTNFEIALQKATNTLTSIGTTTGNGNVIFISDGENNAGGSYSDEVLTLQNAGVKLSAFGVGTDANISNLQVINPSASIFTSTDQLLGVFDGLGSGTQSFKEPGLGGVSIYLDLNNNGVLDAGEPTQVTAVDNPSTTNIDEAGQYSFTNVQPGTYIVREVVPSGFSQTFPNSPNYHTVVVGSGQTVNNINFGNTTPSPVTLTVNPVSVAEDGTTNLVYTFTRTGNLTNALTVNYSVAGTATFNTDYSQTGAATFTSTTGTITLAAGLSTATLTIDPTADTTIEPDETVILTLAAGTGYTVGTTTPVTGTITNGVTLPTITLAVSPSSVTEDGTTNLVYTFTRTGVTTNALTVNYTLGGTATLNTDYTRTGTTNTVTFAAGSATATVTVDPTADTTVEPDETVILTLAAGTGYTVGTTTPVTGTINNDDSASISINDVTVSEGNSGTTNAVFTVTLSNPVDTSVTLNYATANGTATTADNDYTAIATTPLTFNVGETSKTITVAVNGDTKVENNETFFVNLSNLQANGRNVTITDNQGQGTINDDDSTVTSQLSINDITVVEGQNSNAILTVTVNNPSTQQISVNYTTAPINATANVDYTSKTGTITIAPNTVTATISIPILNDNLNEPDEAFTVTLSNAVNATINPDEAIGQVIITDTLQSSITRTLPNNVENLRLIGSNNINGTGNAGDNKITGNSGNNILAGANGNDIYCFNASTQLASDTIQETTTGGIDTLDFTGTNTAVRVNLGTTAVQTAVTNNLKLTFSANNTIENIISDSGNDRLTGNSLNNTLTGGGGNDQLTGQNGNDRLIGGFGDDLLTGGNGSDNFIFNSSNLGIDAISDFTPGSDKIVLSKAIFTALQSIIGNGFSQPAEFASVADDDLVATSSAFIVYSTSSGSIYYNQNGSAAGLGSGSEFANLLTVPTLIAADFTLIN